VRAVLGVDGGGSKTHALVADERGEVLGFASSGRSNWEDTGLEAAGAALAEAIGGALAAAQVPPGALAASAFGLAGLDWDPDRPMLGALLDPLGLAGPRRLENDSFIALRAGASRPFGVVVIAGTGHVAAGRDPAGRTVRTLGLGPMYGDFGSATDVAEEAVRAVADAYTGRGPATSLSRLLPPLAGCASAEQLLQRLSRGLVPLPEAAPLVLRRPRPATRPAARSSSTPAPRWASRPPWWPAGSAWAGSASSWSWPAACSGAGTSCWRGPWSTPWPGRRRRPYRSTSPAGRWSAPPWTPWTWPACPPTRACGTAWSPPPRAWPSSPVRDGPGRFRARPGRRPGRRR
jgi:hypothetical protein